MQLENNDLLTIDKIFRSVKDKSLNWTSKAHTTGVNSSLHPLITKVLGKYIDISGQKIHTAMLLESFIPWSVHTDYDKGDSSPSIAVLIPLESIDAYTIVFDQENLDNDLDSFVSCSKRLDDPTTLAESHTALSHVDPKLLPYLSIKTKARWNKGDLIIWDRKLLHCSDNYKQSGIDNKTAAVIFFTHS